jgi:putative Mg2+ transporter-C (MgtC) family protein
MDIVQTLGWQEITLRLGSAALIGGLLGLNRELKGKPAGLRTNALVSLGSAVLILGSLGISGTTDPATEATVVSRAVQGIITGIGFLGAGVILRDTSGARVHGITTAAMTWLTATLGMLCGAGVWSVSILGVGMALAILILGKPLERFLHRRFPRLSDHDHEEPPPYP